MLGEREDGSKINYNMFRAYNKVFEKLYHLPLLLPMEERSSERLFAETLALGNISERWEIKVFLPAEYQIFYLPAFLALVIEIWSLEVIVI